MTLLLRWLSRSGLESFQCLVLGLSATAEVLLSICIFFGFAARAMFIIREWHKLHVNVDVNYCDMKNLRYS